MLTFKVIPGYVLGFYLVFRAAWASDVWMMVAAGGVFLLTSIYAVLLKISAEAYLIRMNTLASLHQFLDDEDDRKSKEQK